MKRSHQGKMRKKIRLIKEENSAVVKNCQNANAYQRNNLQPWFKCFFGTSEQFFLKEMFQLNESYELDRRILKCVYVIYSP